jgi:hypothetical protein
MGKKLLAIIVILLLISGLDFYYVYQQSKKMAEIGKFDEALCRSLLSKYEPSIVDLEYEEVYANRYLNFSKGDAIARWKINNSGSILDQRDFLPNISYYQFRTFFVWIGDEFEGCGIRYTFFNETKRNFKNYYKCNGSGIEGAPKEIYMEYNDKRYYSIAFELIRTFDSSIQSTYHITFSNDSYNLHNVLNLLKMYGCE